MAVPYVYFEKDPSVSCYDGWICLGGKVWVKDGDYITVYFDVKNGSTAEVAYVKVKIKDISGLNNCDEQEKVKNIDPNSTYSDYFFVYPKGPCQLQLTVEVYDYDRDEFVQTDSKCCFDVSTYTTTPGVDLQVSLDKTMLPEKLRKGDTYTLKVTVQDYPWGNLLDGITVHFYEDGVWKECKISNGTGYGTAVFSWTPTKTGTVTLKFEATTGGATATTEESFEVTEKYPTAVSIFYGCSCTAGESFEVSAYLSYIVGDKYYALAGKTLDFYIGGVKKASATTDSSGNAKVTLTCPSRSEKLEVKFAGDANYEPSSDSCTLYITTPTPTSTPPPTSPPPTTPPPTTPPPGPPPAPEAKFEFVSAGFHYRETPEFKPVSVSYDVENDEWKFEGETITEHLVPDTASALFFSGTVRQTETGASAVCEVRVYDELNDEVLLTINSETEISGEFSFGNQTYFYDGKERRIRIQVGAYEGGTWFKQDETEPLTLKGGKIAIEIKIKNVPEGVEPCVQISELSASGLLFVVGALPSKYGTRLFWTEDEIERDKTYYVYLGQKEKFLGLIEYCGLRAGSIDSFTYTGTKIEKEYDWNEWVYLPSWVEDVCSILGISPFCEDLWDLFGFFCGNLYIELFHKDPYTGEPVEPDATTHVLAFLDILGFIPASKVGKFVSVVAERGEAIAGFIAKSSKVKEWYDGIAKSKLIRGIASMSDETFEKKFLDKLAAEDTKAAEELLDSVIASPEVTREEAFKRIVDAIKETRKKLKAAGRTADDIEDMLSRGRAYAAHAEQTIEVAKDTLKGSWSDIRKLYDQFIAAWEKESPENIYRAVFEGRGVSVEHPVTKEMVSAFRSDIQELAGAPKVKVLVEGEEVPVNVYFDDIFHAFFLKEKDCVKSLKDAGLLNDFLDELRGYVEARPKTYRGLIKQLSDDEFATIVADLNAEGKEAAANLFKQIREAADVIDEGKAGIKDAVKRVADAAEDLTADEGTRKAGAAVFEDLIKSVKALEEELNKFERFEKATDPEKNPLWKRFWDVIWSEAEKQTGKKWSLLPLPKRLKQFIIVTSVFYGFSHLACFALFIYEEALQVLSFTTKPYWDLHWGWEKLPVEEREAIIKDMEDNLQMRRDFRDSLITQYHIATVICPFMRDPYLKFIDAVDKSIVEWEKALEHLKKFVNPVTGVGTCTLSVMCNVDGVHILLDGNPTGKIAGRHPCKIYDVPVRGEEYELSVVGVKERYLYAATTVKITPYDAGRTIDVYLELKEKSDVYIEAPETAENPFEPQMKGVYDPPTFDDMKKTPSPYGVASPKGWWSGEVGDLYCNSYPPGAKILINGMDTGHVTPWTIKSLAEGTYHVTFQKEGYEDCEVVVEVKRGKTAQAYCDFTGECPTPSSVSITHTPSSPTTADTITFTGSAFAGEGHTITSWEWDFGDGTTGSGQTVTHRYAQAGSYQVILTVTNDCGQIASGKKTITVSAPETPTPPPCPSPSGVGISITPSSPSVGELITFTGSAVDGDGHAIVSWEWNFGDGSTATGQVVTHSYAKAGSYKVVLKVTNDCGAYATGSKTITVSEAGTPPPGCPKPTANISYIETTKPYEEQEIELSASGSLGGDTRSIVSYEWDFGDGESATGVEVKHAWKKAGKYTVTLKVTNDCGATDTDTTTVTVEAINDVCGLIKARGGPTGITSVDIQQMILAYHDIISYYFKPTYNAIVGVAAYYRGDISSGDYWTKCHFSESAGFLRLWRLLERMRRS